MHTISGKYLHRRGQGKEATDLATSLLVRQKKLHRRPILGSKLDRKRKPSLSNLIWKPILPITC